MSMRNRLSDYLDAVLARFAAAFPESFWYALDEQPEDEVGPVPIEPLRPDRLTDREALAEVGRQTYESLVAACRSDEIPAGAFVAIRVPHAYERAMEYAARADGRLAAGVKFRDAYARLVPDPHAADDAGLFSNPDMVYDRGRLALVSGDGGLQPDSGPDHARTISH